ncbi:hypothetical protein KEM52_006422 [Ascosphaera acerosa]|nr:hypothetical protein KEM52_006422 [Ascosphaera acerosa]
MAAAGSSAGRTRLVLVLLVLNYLCWSLYTGRWAPAPLSAPLRRDRSKTMVIASMRHENTSWYREVFPDWEHRIYVVDDPTAALTVPRNKGREGNVYLTHSYIIDNYDRLPQYMLFLHAQRYQWHNDDPNYDGIPPLARLRLAHLDAQGFINLRCVHTLGCPVEIRPETDVAAADNVHAGAYFADGFRALFPGEPVPRQIGSPCCAQFGVTRAQVRRRPRADYARYRAWLLNSTLDDALSGRIMEYSWHMIFGKPPVHCPPAKQCYCRQFGLCDLDCDELYGMTCEGRYELPPYSNIPAGWPVFDWYGDVRPGWEAEAERLERERERQHTRTASVPP